MVSPKVAETIAQEVGAQTEVLNPLEGLEDDDIKAGKEYISVMKENLEVLKKRYSERKIVAMDNIIEVNNLSFGYGEKFILKDVSFSVRRGDFGHNRS